MQKYLEGLEALHSAQLQADGSIALGRAVRREPIVTKHPLIRTNPVTGWKSIFFNPGTYFLEIMLAVTVFSCFQALFELEGARKILKSRYSNSLC